MSFGGTATSGSFSARSRESSLNTPRGTNFTLEDDDDEELDKPSKPLPIEVSEDGGVEIKGEDGQRLAFRQGVISIDQVRRLAMQSAYRSGLAN